MRSARVSGRAAVWRWAILYLCIFVSVEGAHSDDCNGGSGGETTAVDVERDNTRDGHRNIVFVAVEPASLYLYVVPASMLLRRRRDRPRRGARAPVR